MGCRWRQSAQDGRVALGSDRGAGTAAVEVVASLSSCLIKRGSDEVVANGPIADGAVSYAVKSTKSTWSDPRFGLNPRFGLKRLKCIGGYLHPFPLVSATNTPSRRARGRGARDPWAVAWPGSGGLVTCVSRVSSVSSVSARADYALCSNYRRRHQPKRREEGPCPPSPELPMI